MKLDCLKLKTILFQKGLKQWQLAQKIGIHETNLSKIIVGRLDPGQILIEKICKALKIEKEDLIKNK